MLACQAAEPKILQLSELAERAAAATVRTSWREPSFLAIPGPVLALASGDLPETVDLRCTVVAPAEGVAIAAVPAAVVVSTEAAVVDSADLLVL